MKLQDQVCTLSQAKKLKELGVKQESLFYYRETLNGFALGFKDNDINLFTGLIEPDTLIEEDEEQVFSAFTPSELGVMLPDYCETWRDEDKIWCAKDSSSIHPFKGETEAQAKAALLIFLIEAQLTNIE